MPRAAFGLWYNQACKAEQELLRREGIDGKAGWRWMGARRREAVAVGVFLVAYFLLNLLFLTRYPLVHSDESWLGGLTRNMMAQGSPMVTEPFFDLKPRYPHAIKILFHLLQMPFIGVFGYGILAVRLLSLCAGCLALLLVYRIAREVASHWLSIAMMVTVLLNAVFIAAAHTARQEILLFAMLLWLLLELMRRKGVIDNAGARRLGVITGLSVGFHPNSFLLATGCAMALLLLMVLQKRFLWKPLLVYIAATACVALIFVGLSFLFDSQFHTHYRMYGESEFEITVPLTEKMAGFHDYLSKLWQGISGTYTLPGLKAQLIITGILFLMGTVRALQTRQSALIAMVGMAAGTLLGTIVIGRYNQLSASLWLLPGLMLLAPLLADLRPLRLLLPALMVLFAVVSVNAVVAAYPYDYGAYLTQVAAYAQPNEKALANLNTGFYFDNDALLDVRNLAYLKQNGLTFAEYVHSRGIEVILWPQEMDLIYERRPAFNALYGNPRATPEVRAFLQEQCTFLGTFENPGYAVRLAQEIGTAYSVDVYRVNPRAGA